MSFSALKNVPAPVRPNLHGSWTDSAKRVMKERYLQVFTQDEVQVYERPEDMFWRVALDVAAAELGYEGGEERFPHYAEKFYEAMVSRKFLPNSPTLMNAGTQNGLGWSACYVLPVEDSIQGIFGAMGNAALIHKAGGGTGFSFSRLREEGSVVSHTRGIASGPVSFLKVFDAATEAVKQGGRRRGANMCVLRCDHPDIEKFIDCKLKGGITNFNISVGITDVFMAALSIGGYYDLVSPATGKRVDTVSAKVIWGKIVDAAWATGDPGLVFLDVVNLSPSNPIPQKVEIEATNPCGEQALPPNDACCLGSINLSEFVLGDQILYEDLGDTVSLAIRFLDDILDRSPYPLPEVAETVRNSRRVGLGVMGWADLLFKLEIPYDSEDALALAGRVMSFISEKSIGASEALALEKGAFPLWEESIYAESGLRRNSTTTSIAPTGTISILAGCSSGIEPVFALGFRHIVGDRELVICNEVFRAKVEERYGPYWEGFVGLALKYGSFLGLDVPSWLKRVFVTAHEVSPLWHVRTQAAFQAHTDNGVSKTVNLPHDSSKECVAEVFEAAYDLGCRGITIFRDGCKGEQVLNMGTVQENKVQEDNVVRERPVTLEGVTVRTKTPFGSAYLTVNHDSSGSPLEIFLNIGKAGSDVAAVSEGIGRLVSLILRLPSTMAPKDRLEEVAQQLKGIGGASPVGFGANRVMSLPDGISQVLSRYLFCTHIDEELAAEEAKAPGKSKRSGADLCPTCGNVALVGEEGCRKCYSCGHSEC